MKCAIVADTKLIPKGKDYYSMTMTHDFLANRYLKYYDELYFISRVDRKKNSKGDISGYKITNGEKVSVNPIAEYEKVTDAIKNKKIIEKKIYEVISKCDIVIIRLPNILGLITCSLCKKYNIKYLVEVLACPYDSYKNHQNKLGKILAPFMYYLNKKAIRNSPKVLYVTDKFLQNRYPTKGDSINCSDVVLSAANEKQIKQRIEKIKNIHNNDEIKIATVANVGLRHKGHEYIIKALSLTNNKKIKYYLIGNGDTQYLVKALKKYNLEDRVIFLGSVPHEKIFQILGEMDLYIQPSLAEGMPRALLEAMSTGIPCYGSEAGGIPELLDKKYVFKKKDYERITEILDNLNVDQLLNNSKSVYEKVKEFGPKILNAKRDKFYKA